MPLYFRAAIGQKIGGLGDSLLDFRNGLAFPVFPLCQCSHTQVPQIDVTGVAKPGLS